MLVLLLTGFIIFLCLFGRIPTVALIAVSCLPIAVAGTMRVLGCAHGHSHENMLASIDSNAVRSGLYGVNPGLKMALFFGTLVSVLTVGSWAYDTFVCITMCLIITWPGHTPLRVLMRLAEVPIGFILAGSVVILLDFSPNACGIINIPAFGKWLVLTKEAQSEAVLTIARCVAAVCCLCGLSLTTPVFEITEVMRRIRVPKIIIELMFLIYRYIFVLMTMLVNISTAAECRMGYNGFKATFRTASGMLFSLLVGALKCASASFDAMESRCYDGTLRFYRTDKPVRAFHVTAGVVYCAALAAAAVLERKFL